MSTMIPDRPRNCDSAGVEQRSPLTPNGRIIQVIPEFDRSVLLPPQLREAIARREREAAARPAGEPRSSNRIVKSFGLAAKGEPPRKIAYHVTDGPVEMPTIDANSAVAAHPKEWSFKPWNAVA